MRLPEAIRPFDVIATAGKVRIPQDLWPPWEAVAKWQVYNHIRKYQQWRGHRYWPWTHIRVCTETERFFEWTTPKARYGSFSELEGKDLWILRPQLQFNGDAVLRACNEAAGLSYDYKELIRFAAEYWPGYELLAEIVGKDRANRYVCSTGVAMAFNAGGYPWAKTTNPRWQGWCPSQYGERGSSFRLVAVQ